SLSSRSSGRAIRRLRVVGRYGRPLRPPRLLRDSVSPRGERGGKAFELWLFGDGGGGEFRVYSLRGACPAKGSSRFREFARYASGSRTLIGYYLSTSLSILVFALRAGSTNRPARSSDDSGDLTF